MMTNEELYDLCHRMLDVDYEVGILTWKDIPEVSPKVRGKEAGWKDCISKRYDYSCRSVILRYSKYKYHRILYLMYHKHLPECLDHIDGNPLNNSISNLREATRAQNSRNRRNNRNRLNDLPKGVFKNRNRYRASIKVNNTRIGLGTYDTPEEAHQAYIEAAKRLHGDFARFD